MKSPHTSPAPQAVTTNWRDYTHPHAAEYIRNLNKYATILATEIKSQIFHSVSVMNNVQICPNLYETISVTYIVSAIRETGWCVDTCTGL